MVSNDTKGVIKLQSEDSRIESEIEIQAFLHNMTYALDNAAEVDFQIERRIDQLRDERYTNRYTISTLFPDENPIHALKRELKNLKLEDYIRTIKDKRFPNRGEMREFGKVYNNRDVYIKVRVKLLINAGSHIVFVMSFHFAIIPFTVDDFPYKRK